MAILGKPCFAMVRLETASETVCVCLGWVVCFEGVCWVCVEGGVLKGVGVVGNFVSPTLETKLSLKPSHFDG